MPSTVRVVGNHPQLMIELPRASLPWECRQLSASPTFWRLSAARGGREAAPVSRFIGCALDRGPRIDCCPRIVTVWIYSAASIEIALTPQRV